MPSAKRNLVVLAPVDGAQLKDLLNRGFKLVEHLVDYDESEGYFFRWVMSEVRLMPPEQRYPLAFRAIAAYQMLCLDGERMESEGILESVDSSKSSISLGVIAAFATMECKLKTLEGAVEPIYSLDEVIALAKKYEPLQPRFKLVDEEGFRSPALIAGPAGSGVANLMDAGLDGAALFDLLAESGAPEWKFAPEDYPAYQEFLGRRTAALEEVEDRHRPLFEVDKFHPDSREARIVNAMMGPLESGEDGSGMDEALKIRALEYGPWSMYPLLDQVPAWNWPAYREAVLSSTAAASVPCLNGCLPVYYVARHGTVSDLQKILHLNPGGANAQDVTGRHILMDVTQLKNGLELTQMLLHKGASPQAGSGLGKSVFTAMLITGRLAVADLLLRKGYKPQLDESLTKEVIDLAMAQASISTGLRRALDRHFVRAPDGSPGFL